MLSKNIKKGFTLIELVLVIMIISILAAIIVPSVTNISNKSRNAASDADLKTITTAVGMFVQETGEIPVDYVRVTTQDMDTYYANGGTQLDAATATGIKSASADAPMFVLINFNKLTAQYTINDSVGTKVGPYLKSMPKSSALIGLDSLGASLQSNKQASVSLSYVYVVDHFGRVFLAKGSTAFTADIGTAKKTVLIKSDAVSTTLYKVYSTPISNDASQVDGDKYYIYGTISPKVN